MSGEPLLSDEAALATRRLALDLEDLRFENARLKMSIAERQAEIEALSERLGLLQAQIVDRHRVKAWILRLIRLGLGPLRVVLRRG